MTERIRSAVAAELETLGVQDVAFAVEWPAELEHGDFAVNAALAASKALGKPPQEIAEAIAPGIREALGDDIASVEVAGPGFVNITLSSRAIAGILQKAGATDEEWGRNSAQEGRRVMVEYTDPNPFKEMHIGHLMSNVIGESVSRLVDYSGATLARANYEGDVGPHVAKALWGLRKKGVKEPATAKELGTAYAQGTRAYEESEEAKQEIDLLNRNVYEALAKEPAQHGEEERELLELWRKGRDVSLAAFEDIYRILGTKFDYYFFESETSGTGMQLVQDGIERGVFRESEGAIIYPGEEKGLHTLVFVTSRGTPTYEAKELGLAFLKEERWPADNSIILTAAEQIGHFMVVKAALKEIAPELGAKTRHLPHGFLRLTTGKMSSREGNVITAADLIEQVIAKVSEKNEDPLVAEQVALGAIKYSILKSSAGADISFDFDRSLSLDGDSGPYLQYAYVRATSILASATQDQGVYELPPHTYNIARLLTRFPEVVKKAQALEAPHVVTQYLTQLAGEWNSFYAKERILGGEFEDYKLVLVRAFATTMKNGLWLLGIPAPEKM
ncbi:MAG TPA: arginine--tRNA ligase [Candidatus Paceibacterota bacterium]|jgi:arginyl-tRNA synthetase